MKQPDSFMHNFSLSRIIYKLFLLITACISIYLFLFIIIATSKIQPDTTFFYNDFHDYIYNKADADILVIGNSKALSSLSSNEIRKISNSKAYNMAYVAANLDFTKDLLVSYLHRSQKKPSICILEVSWFSFSNARTYYPHDKPQLDLIFNILKPPHELFRYNNIKKIVGIFRENGLDIVKTYANKKMIADHKYVDWWDGPPLKRPAVFDPDHFDITEMKSIFPKLEAGVDNTLLESYKDIILICKNNNIKLILYTAPEAPVYTSLQKDNVLIKNIILKSAQDNGLKYFDFTVDGQYYCKELDTMLFDSQHVRKATEFTLLFMSVLKENNLM